jgi:1,4-alpha-glucan branching enzyme
VLVGGPQLPAGAGPAPAVAVAPDGAARLYVQFRLEAPGASEVRLAGSFTGWQPELELRETAPGVWSALVPLEPGVHDYTFVVNGEEWVVDPYAPRVEDSFGGSNSRLFLPLPAGSA